ncbi:hypothetical protein FA15DRAFT_262217 [Coprinopsis marcescibilis]|uniref:Uncharacterized protein n=1 Tax=Coprinopsis marcescibilis TaxID=230819 RepID=A0A5C3KF32_COPMA|nr:hypothetical protein FA15DRAFT_262217 [Coprinopsis marcescibilis]
MCIFRAWSRVVGFIGVVLTASRLELGLRNIRSRMHPRSFQNTPKFPKSVEQSSRSPLVLFEVPTSCVTILTSAPPTPAIASAYQATLLYVLPFLNLEPGARKNELLGLQ